MEKPYKKEISEVGKKPSDVLNSFLKEIKGDKISETEFIYNGEKWFIDFHPFDHSDDIIVEDKIIDNYDKFLLVKKGSEKIRIPGWCDKKILKSTPARDIYRNGKNYFVVMDTNINNLSNFKLTDENYVLKKDFIINKQEADNLGHSEMISGILSGLHKFCKEAGIFFKDINQNDECIIGDKKAKIYTRDIYSDEDMLIKENYYQKNKERIDIYILCKIKGGKYNYLGYIDNKIVAETLVVQMEGKDASGKSDPIRRIFAEQYLNLSNMIEIYEKKLEEGEEIVKQNYVPLHVHSEWSVGDGFGKTDYMTETLKEKGFQACALTDHGTLAGVWNFQKSCLLNNIKPIIGCELYVSLGDKTKERFHLTTLVKNEKGWKNLLKIQNDASRKNFYYKPIVDFDFLINNCEGLIILSGCSSGILSVLLKEDENLVLSYIKLFKEKLNEDFYIEIQPQDIEDNQKIMEKLYNMALKNNIKCVFTNDVHYPKKEDKRVHDAVKAINFKKKYGEAGYSDDCFYFMQEEDIEKRVMDRSIWMIDIYKDLLKNTLEISEKCNFEIKPSENKDTLPSFIFEEKDNESLSELFEEFNNWLPKNEEEEKDRYLLHYHPAVENE